MSSHPTEVAWTGKTLAAAAVASLAGLLLAIVLRNVGAWPDWEFSEYLFGGICGATAVHRLHREKPVIALLVFVPVMAALLLVVTLLVYVYVFGKRPEF